MAEGLTEATSTWGSVLGTEISTGHLFYLVTLRTRFGFWPQIMSGGHFTFPVWQLCSELTLC